MPGAYGVHWLGMSVYSVVFDFDGTLTDSLEAYYEIFRDVTARYGIQVNKRNFLNP